MASEFDSVRKRRGSKADNETTKNKSDSEFSEIRNRSGTVSKTIDSSSSQAFMDNHSGTNKALSAPKEPAKNTSPRLEQPKINPLEMLLDANAKTQGNYGRSTLQKIGQGLKDFPGAFTDSITGGVSDLVGRAMGVETKDEQNARDKRTGGAIGKYSGYVMPGAIAERGAAKLLQPIIKNAPKAVQTVARGIGGGALFGVGTETAEAITGENDQTIKKRLVDAGIETAAGGILGGVGAGARAIFGKSGKTIKKPIEGVNEAAKVAFEEGVDVPSLLQGQAPTLGRIFAQNPPSKINRPMIKPKNDPINLDVEFTPSAKTAELDELQQRYNSMVDRLNKLSDAEDASTGSAKRKAALEYDKFSKEVFKLGDQIIALENGTSAPTLGRIVAGVDSQSNKTLLGGLLKPIKELGDVATGGANSGFAFGKRAATNASPTMRHIVSSTKKESGTLAGAAEKAYIDTVDDIFALKKADDIAAQAKGRGLNPTESSYGLAMASRGSDQVARQILTDKMVDASGNVVGDGFKEVMGVVGKGNIKKFEDYMLNRHAITRFARGEKVYPDSMKWTPDTGESIVNAYEAKFPNFKDAASKLADFDDQFNQVWRVDTGLLKPEVVKAWKDANPTYINMNRKFSDLEKAGNGVRSKRGLVGQKDPTKAYGNGGSERPIIRPVESKIQTVDATVKAANRNRSMQALVKNIKDHPDAYEGLAEIVPDAPQLASFKNIDLTTPDGMDEMLARLDDSFTSAMKSTRKDLDNIVPVMVNGEPVYVKIHNKNLLDAVASINPQTLDAASKFASTITNAWKAMLTGINPVFTLTRSIFRDPVSAYVQSKSTNNPVRFVTDLAQGAWAVMKDGELYKEYRRMGGGYNSPNIGTPRLLNRTMRDILPSDKVMQGVLQRLGDKLGEALNRIESVPRIGEYKRLRGSGTLDEKLKALSEAQEVAVNFKRKGQKGRVVDAWFPYFNAAVQSLDKLGRSLKDKPGATIAKAGLSVTVPSLLLYLKNHNDPDYQKLNEFEKDRFLHIPIGNGKFFRYPIPQELVPFAAVPRRVMQKMNEDDPEAWRDFGKTMRELFLPPGVSGAVGGLVEGGFPEAAVGIAGDTFAGPLVDVAANKTWSGGPIVPGHLEKTSPKLQSDARTSELAKKISNITGGSPMKLDYLIKQYGGDLGNIGVGISEKGVMKAGPGILEGIGKRLIVDSAVSNDSMNNFYDLKDKYDTMYADIKASGDIPKGYNDEVRLYLGRVADDMSEVSKALRAIDKTDLTPAQKKEEKRKLTILRNDAASQAYKDAQSALNIMKK